MSAAAAIQIAEEPPFEIGGVEVRPAAREVVSPQGLIVIEPRILQVLILLARARGEVVTRQALIDGCWEGRIVGEDAINRAILKLRKVAERSGGFEIQTIPKVGYRLMESASSARHGAADSSRRRWLMGGAAAAGAAAVAGGAALILRRGPDARSRQAEALYARGEAAFQQGSPADNAQAVGFFEKAAELAPRDGRILGALALAYRFEQTFRPIADRPAATARADRATARALAAAPNDPDAIAAASLYVPFDGHWLETERRMLWGLPRAPRSGVLHAFHGMLLRDVGRTREAVRELRTAQPLSAFVPILRTTLVRALFADGQTPAAEAELQRGRTLWPRDRELWWLGFWIPALTRRPEEAIRHLEAGADQPSDLTDALRATARLSAEALAQPDAGRTGSALAAWRREIKGPAAWAARDVAGFAAAAGDRDQAFEIAEQILAPYATPGGHPLRQPGFLFDPGFASLRSDPRLSRLFEMIRLTDYWRASGTRPDIG